MTSLLATRPAPELPPGPRAALIVATSCYDDEALPPLRATVRDAAEMAAAMADPAIGAFNVTSILDQNEKEIRLAIDDFLSGRGRDDLVVIYLSCHGLLDVRDRLYFAAKDTLKDHLASTGVESAWLLDRLEECRSTRQVIILDCCFSGAFARSGGKGSNGSDLHLRERLISHGRGRAILTASKATQRSWESDSADDIVTPSVFTSALVEGLKTGNADTDRDGYISVDDAYTYAYERVTSTSLGQTPQYWKFAGEGTLWLARNPAGMPVNPDPLPESITAALENPIPSVRIGAVKALGEWLASSEPGKTLAAWQMLHEVVKADSPAVATVARDVIGTLKSTAVKPEVAQSGLPTATAPLPLGTFHLQRLLTNGRRRLFGQPQGNTHRFTAAVFSSDGRLATASPSRARLWDPVTGRRIRAFSNSSGWGVAFSADNRLLGTIDNTGHTVHIWDLAANKQIRTLAAHTNFVWAVAFSPDGQLIATTSDDRTTRIWDLASARQVRTLPGHKDEINWAAFSHNGEMLATTSDDMRIILWDPITGKRLRTFTGHTQSVYGVAFSPDDRLLASGSGDNTARIWSVATGKRVHTITGHTDKVIGTAFSPDGELLATASGDTTARLWDVKTGKNIQTLTGHTLSVNWVAFNPEGDLLATTSDDGTVRIWAKTQERSVSSRTVTG